MKKALFLVLPIVLLLAAVGFTSKHNTISFQTSQWEDSTGSIRFVIRSVDNVTRKADLEARIHIVDANTNMSVFQGVVRLQSENSMIATKPITLKKGKYKLIEFSVADKDDAESELASQITNDFVMLPWLFSVKN